MLKLIPLVALPASSSNPGFNVFGEISFILKPQETFAVSRPRVSVTQPSRFQDPFE